MGSSAESKAAVLDECLRQQPKAFPSGIDNIAVHIKLVLKLVFQQKASDCEHTVIELSALGGKADSNQVTASKSMFLLCCSSSSFCI